MAASLRVEIFPADLDVTVEFYRDVLGFALERDQRPDYVALRRDAVLLGAGRRAPVAAEWRLPPAGVELVLEVDDLEAERRRVAAAGRPVQDEIAERPWGLRDFRLLDPDGHYWRLTDRTPPGG